MKKKEAKLNSNIYFLSLCKKHNFIPRGLNIYNPLTTTHISKYASQLCRRTSEKIRNHLLHLLYSKRDQLRKEITIYYNNLKDRNPFMFPDNIQWIQRNYEKLSTAFILHKKKKWNKLLQEQAPQAQNNHQRNNTNTLRPSNLRLDETESSNQPTNIINLSTHTLTKTEKSVLSKGLNFCPEKYPNKILQCGELEEFFQRLCLKEYFHDQIEPTPNNNSSSDNIQERINAKKPQKTSDWTPHSGRNPKLDRYIDCFRERMNNEIISNTRHHNNLSLPEKKAIECLRSNHQIVIKPADKGGAIVILNREDYIKEANRQLSDTTYYKELQEDPTPLFTKKTQQYHQIISIKTTRKTTDLDPPAT
ncbi:uncharacterized protein LOC109283246 isoform X2 [Alligator mississippiensis]|uniref:uncharacterized protein LOC109283246 isoform X2 n=1 Tax=Alligator mississippiensis TaxID=8496 RepID=UPI00287784A6|nr:uncharacterized protein LOC109283246 isoform X2 [Alligator mississippiensis]